MNFLKEKVGAYYGSPTSSLRIERSMIRGKVVVMSNSLEQFSLDKKSKDIFK